MDPKKPPEKRKKSFIERAIQKRELDKRLGATRVILGDSFVRWRKLKESKGFATDGLVAAFLLDNYEKDLSTSPTYPPLSSVFAESLSDRDDDFSVAGIQELDSSAEGTALKQLDARYSHSSDKPQVIFKTVVAEIPSPAESLSVQNTKSKEVPSEEGCSGITFDVSEITVASDDESTCSAKGQQDADCSSLNGHQTVVAEIPSPAESLSVQNTKSKEVPSEEGCSGITFDVSEITFASDDESTCSDNGHDDEEEEDEEQEDKDEKSSTDSVWETSETESDKFEEDELSSDSELPVKLRQLCPDCGAFFNTSKSHTCEYKIKPYSCNVCGKRCVDENGLKSHTRIHKEDYEHFCKFCLAAFKTRLNKLAHEETHAPDGRPYQCPDCSLTFSKIHERNLHLKDHRGPKIFSCPHCNLEFAAIHSLKRHVVVHTGVKPFICKFCSRSFNQAGHLKSHMRLHTGEKPFQCQHCNKSFNHNVSLKSHAMRYHSGASDSNSSESNRHIENVERSVAGQDQMREREESSGDDENMSDDHTDQAREVSPLEKGPMKKVKTKSYWRPTGRPKGRPKRNAAVGDMSLVPAVSGEAQDPSTAAKTLKVGRLKRTSPKDIESNGSDGDSTLELSGEDEWEGTNQARKSKRGASKRSKNFDYEDYDSDSDFDPLEEMKKSRTRVQSLVS